MLRVSLLACLAVLSGCPLGDDEGGTDSCMCTPETALQTSYDNASSQLGAENVQDALDELDTAGDGFATTVALHTTQISALEMRPVPEAPVGGRLELVVQDFPNPGTSIVSVTANCPQPATDIAIGGSCEAVANGSLLGSTLLVADGVAGFACSWSQIVGTTDMLHVRVMCLHGAR